MNKILRDFILKERPWVWKSLLVVMLLAGFALRMLDLKDLPLDFAPTRQLYSALKARAMYYEYLPDAPEWMREVASRGSLSNIEPPIMEVLVSQTWRVTGEHLWVARIYSSLFWVAGGLALFFLAREMASTGAAFISTLVYLFVPYGVIASRAFQPDPLMVMLVVFSLWALFRWQVTDKWKWALLFGLFGGLALFVKNTSALLVGLAFLGVILGAVGLRRALKSWQVWAIGILLVLPVGIYTLWGVLTGSLEGQFGLRFFPNLWLDPSFYFSWQNLMSTVTGFSVWAGGLVGILLAEARRARPLLLGVWLGYLLFGFTFSYHFITHDYYHLPLIPIAALSLAPLIQWIFEGVARRNTSLFPRMALVALVLFATAVYSWHSVSRLRSEDYRSEVAFWQEMGALLGHDASVIGLTQDYGYRLAYWGWQSSSAWYTGADIEVRYLAGQEVDVAEQFLEDTAGKQYFLVTLFGEFENQPVIREYLYDHYAIYAETDEYILFDLEQAANGQP